MSLSAHELFLIVRARDEASRIIHGLGTSVAQLQRQINEANRQGNQAQVQALRQQQQRMQQAQATFQRGSAIAGVGAGLAAMGLAGVKAFSDMTNEAIKYNKQVAYTQTQTQGTGISMKTLHDIGMKAGHDIAVSFEEIQPALYDIFSSITVNAPQAAKLLETIGKAAVGGNVDMETAGRSLIGILNAYKMKVTEVNKVNDTMFQLVAKGVGTYKQVADTIGRSVPSAIKAGQSFQQLAGMTAFLTRNHLSNAMAAAAVGRALDALANSKVYPVMKKFGPVAEGVLKKFAGPERVAAIESLHKGFNKISIDMHDAHGNMRPVVDIIADMNKAMVGLTKPEKAAVVQKLFQGAGGTIQAMRFFNHALNDSNGLLKEMTDDMYHANGAAADAYKTMSNTPAAKIQLMKNRWQEMKITIGEQLLPVKMKLVEILGKIVGWFSHLNPHVQKFIIFALAGAAALATILGILGVIVGTMMMFAAAAAAAGTSLLAISGIGALVVAAIAAIVAIVIVVIKHWDTIKRVATETWNKVYDAMKPVVEYMASRVMPIVKDVADFFIRVWQRVWPVVKQVWDKIVSGIKAFIKIIGDHTKGLGKTFQGAGEAFKHVFNFITGVIKVAWALMKPFIAFFVATFIGAFKLLAPVIVPVFKLLGTVIGNFINIFKDIIKVIIALINGDWSKAWHAALHIVTDIWNGITGIFSHAWDVIKGIVKGIVDGIINFFKHLWDMLVGHSIIPDMINAIVKWFMSLPGKILAAVGELVGKLVSWALGLGEKVLSGIATGFGKVIDWFKKLPGRIVGWIGDVGKALLGVGVSLMMGLWNGILAMVDPIVKGVQGIVHGIQSLFSGSPSQGLAGGSPLAILKAQAAAKHAGDRRPGQTQRGQAMGTTSFSGGLTWVGEKGPELVKLPTGARVYNNRDSRKMATSGANAPVQNFYITTQEIDPQRHAANLGWEIARRVR